MMELISSINIGQNINLKREFIVWIAVIQGDQIEEHRSRNPLLDNIDDVANDWHVTLSHDGIGMQY